MILNQVLWINQSLINQSEKTSIAGTWLTRPAQLSPSSFDYFLHTPGKQLPIWIMLLFCFWIWWRLIWAMLYMMMIDMSTSGHCKCTFNQIKSWPFGNEKQQNILRKIVFILNMSTLNLPKMKDAQCPTNLFSHGSFDCNLWKLIILKESKKFLISLICPKVKGV